MAEETRVCPHCQAQVRTCLTFCSECGQELPPSTGAQTREAQRRIDRRRIALVLAIILALLCLSCGALVVVVTLVTPVLLTPAEEMAAELTPAASAALLATATQTPTTVPLPVAESPVPTDTAVPSGALPATSTSTSVAERR